MEVEVADEKNIETVVLNEQDIEAETVVLDEDFVKEITRDEARSKIGGDAQSRVVRLDPDLKEEADKSREDAS